MNITTIPEFPRIHFCLCSSFSILLSCMNSLRKGALVPSLSHSFWVDLSFSHLCSIHDSTSFLSTGSSTVMFVSSVADLRIQSEPNTNTSLLIKNIRQRHKLHQRWQGLLLMRQFILSPKKTLFQTIVLHLYWCSQKSFILCCKEYGIRRGRNNKCWILWSRK